MHPSTWYDPTKETKFTSHDFQSLIHVHGIHHRFSCVYMPQQNGKVERKHRHILQVAWSLMIHSHLPLWFWNECILTFVYLINCTPSPLLHNETPYFKLFREMSSYVHLKFFGCLCYATINAPKFKFDHQSVKEVFLGYSPHWKGSSLTLILGKLSLPITSNFLMKFSLFTKITFQTLLRPFSMMTMYPLALTLLSPSPHMMN